MNCKFVILALFNIHCDHIFALNPFRCGNGSRSILLSKNLTLRIIFWQRLFIWQLLQWNLLELQVLRSLQEPMKYFHVALLGPYTFWAVVYFWLMIKCPFPLPVSHTTTRTILISFTKSAVRHILCCNSPHCRSKFLAIFIVKYSNIYLALLFPLHISPVQSHLISLDKSLISSIYIPNVYLLFWKLLNLIITAIMLHWQFKVYNSDMDKHFYNPLLQRSL